MLYRIAKEVGATKIALGHHADDFIETLLLNLFFAGALKAMPAKLVSDDGAHVVIRPLVYVGEDEARAYTKECELPIIGCCCPACGDLGLQRQRAKRLLMELEREHPGVKTFDAEGARQRRAAASARHAAESAGRAARPTSPLPKGLFVRNVRPVAIACSRRSPVRSQVLQPAGAQQRPLVTEDPEPIGAGRVLLEGGIDFGAQPGISRVRA